MRTAKEIVQALDQGPDVDGMKCRLCGADCYLNPGSVVTPLCDPCAQESVELVRTINGVVPVPEQLLARLILLVQGMVLACEGRAPLTKVHEEARLLVNLWARGAAAGHLPSIETLNQAITAQQAAQAPASPIAQPDRRIVLPGEE